MTTPVDRGTFSYLVDREKFYPLTATSDEIKTDVVAHSLSRICRYGGHTDRHYSVAQHAWVMSYLIEQRDLLPFQALHHDDAEAYIGDMVYPLKRLPELAGFNAVDKQLSATIAARYGMDTIYPDEVSQVDRNMIYHESQSGGPVPAEWEDASYKRPDQLYKITFVPAWLARRLYMSRHNELTTAEPAPVHVGFNRLMFRLLVRRA